MLLIILSKWFTGQKYTVTEYDEKKTKKQKKTRHSHVCKLVNSWELYRFLCCSRVKSQASLQLDACTRISVLI